MFNQYKQFLVETFQQLQDLSIPFENLTIDHIAYTAGSKKEYEKLKPLFIGMGRLVAEDIVGGRRVSVVRLNEPLIYENRKIPGAELIEPIADSQTISRIDHIEMIIPMGFKQFMKSLPSITWDTSSMTRAEYPHLKVKGLRVKFHELSIFDTIERQKRSKEQL
jgi:predicted metalloenzyme YecM